MSIDEQIDEYLKNQHGYGNDQLDRFKKRMLSIHKENPEHWDKQGLRLLMLEARW